MESKNKRLRENYQIPLGLSKRDFINKPADNFTANCSYATVPNSPEQLYIGDDNSGNPIIIELTNNPHALLFGHCRSGKTRTLQIALTNLMLNTTDKDVNLHIIAPSKSDLWMFERFPHVKSLSTSLIDTHNNLHRVISEVNDRMQFMKILIQDGQRFSISEYNSTASDDSKFPIIYIAIDELQELVINEYDDDQLRMLKRIIMKNIFQIAQYGNKVGVYLIATSINYARDYIPPFVKANMCNMVSFDWHDGLGVNLEYCNNKVNVLVPKADEKYLFNLLKAKYSK